MGCTVKFFFPNSASIYFFMGFQYYTTPSKKIGKKRLSKTHQNERKIIPNPFRAHACGLSVLKANILSFSQSRNNYRCDCGWFIVIQSLSSISGFNLKLYRDSRTNWWCFVLWSFFLFLLLLFCWIVLFDGNHENWSLEIWHGTGG